MTSADAGTDILVTVRYMPKNNLSHNDEKELAFAVTVRPETEATFPGGKEHMHQYLAQSAIDRIPVGTFQGYDLAAITFTVAANGGIDNVRIVESSNDEEVDALLVKTISAMPRWNPATYADGTRVKQAFAFTAGNMENCMIQTLNILEQ
jgi:TonB family protein